MKKVLSNIFFVLAVIVIFFSGVYLYLDIKWSRELEDTLEKLNLSNALPNKKNLIPPKIPDSKNAAIEFEKIFKNMTTGSRGKEFTWDGGDKLNSMIERILACDSKDKIEFPDKKNTTIVKDLNSTQIARIIDFLKSAEQKPYLNFYIDYEAGPDMLLPHLKLIRKLYKIISLKALLYAQNGSLPEAYNLLLTGLKTSILLKQEPIMISQLLRIANDIRLINTLKIIINTYGIDTKTAYSFISEISSHNKIDPFIKIADTEMVYMGMYIYEGLLYGKEDLAWKSIKKLLNNPIPLDYLPTFLLIPFLKKDYTEYLRQMTEFKSFLKTPYWELSEERLSKLLNSTEAPPDYCIICKMIMPSLIKLLQKITNYRTDISNLSRI